MKKQTVAILLALLLALGLLVPASAEEKALSDETLIVGVRGEAVNLYPPDQNDASSGPVVHLTHNQLVVPDPDTGEIIGCLAESWEQIDDLTYRFYLRKGVVSHAGDPFTAEDVRFSFIQGGKSTVKAYVWEPFDTEATTVVDEYTVDIKTKEPYAPAMRLLAENGQGILMMVEKSFTDQGDETDYSRSPIGGTGPWKLKEWIAGDRIILERNDDYWGEKPYYKTLVLRNITDDITRALAMEAGDIDVCLDVAPSQAPSLRDTGGITVYQAPTWSTAYVGFNCKKPYLEDVRVRKALRYATDLDAIIKLAYAGVGRAADAMVPPHHDCYIPAEGDLAYTFDLEKARALMEEVGCADGFTINLWANENQTRIDLAEMLQNMWGQINVTVNVEIMEWGAYLDKLSTGEHDAYILGYGLNGNDGDYLRSMWYTDGYESNRFGYSNARFDELADLARTEFDHAKRIEYYNEIINLIREDVPCIPVQWSDNIFAFKSSIEGFREASYAPQDYIQVRPVE